LAFGPTPGKQAAQISFFSAVDISNPWAAKTEALYWRLRAVIPTKGIDPSLHRRVCSWLREVSLGLLEVPIRTGSSRVAAR
jgi:hypothetical protein